MKGKKLPAARSEDGRVLSDREEEEEEEEEEEMMVPGMEGKEEVCMWGGGEVNSDKSRGSCKHFDSDRQHEPLTILVGKL